MILVLTLFGLMNCSLQEGKQKNAPSIQGEWQLIERFDGGSLEPNQPVENGYKITFHKTGKVTTDHPTIGCTSDYKSLEGNYSLGSENGFSILSLKLNCNNNELNLKYIYSFEDQFLLLTELESTCDEGCYDKFSRSGNSK